MAITLRTIAEHAGVSLPTASQILKPNSKRAALFSPETRHRVEQIAQQMGYRTNTAARSIATGRFNCVSLLLSVYENRSLTPRELLDGIDDTLVQHDMHLVLARLDDGRLTDEGFMPRLLRSWTSDGLLINYNAHIPPRMIELIRQFQLPSVWINSKHECDCVHPDDFGAARHLTEALIARGHRRIAFVDYTYGTCEGSRHYSNLDRRAGYEQAMAAAGLPVRMICANGNIPDAQRVAFSLDWMRAPDRPSAVVTYTNCEASALLAAMDRIGLTPGRDWDVVTISDIPVVHFDVRLPTAVLPERTIGALGAQRLLEKINGQIEAFAPMAVPFTYEQMDALGGPAR